MNGNIHNKIGLLDLTKFEQKFYFSIEIFLSHKIVYYLILILGSNKYYINGVFSKSSARERSPTKQ